MKSREELFDILESFSLIKNPSNKTILYFVDCITNESDFCDSIWLENTKDKILKFVNHENNVSEKKMRKFAKQFKDDVVETAIKELIGEKMIYTATNHKGMSYWSKARFEREFNN